MPKHNADTLQWIDTQRDTMIMLVERWAAINSGSDNLDGLAEMLKALNAEFSCLGGECQVLTLSPRRVVSKLGALVSTPLGQALVIKKRPEAPLQVLFGGHMDTVYSPTHPFQKTERLDDHTLRGPGVADMKGGLVVLLKALEAFEKSSQAALLGWEIILNPDEEIGSPGSAPLFVEAAKRHHVGLIFEPSYPDGAFVSERKGSGNYTIIAKGRAAHAGRDFHLGTSAIYAIATIVHNIQQLIVSPCHLGTSINVGQIEGGSAVNIVPDLAICRLNIRSKTIEGMRAVKAHIDEIVKKEATREGIQLKLVEDSCREPKLFDAATANLFAQYRECAEELGIPFKLRESGGVCDGNILCQAGLPTLDSAGAVGGNIHTADEYLLLDSLTERAKLTILFLLKLTASTASSKLLNLRPRGLDGALG